MTASFEDPVFFSAVLLKSITVPWSSKSYQSSKSREGALSEQKYKSGSGKIER